MHIYTYTCRILIDAMNKTSEDFFKKIYLSLYCKIACERGSLRPNKDCNILTSPAPPDIAMCRSRSPGLLNRGPGTQPLWDMFSFQHLLTNGSPNSLGGPEGPFCWVVAFSTTSCLQLFDLQTGWGSRGPLLPGGGFLYHLLSLTHLISNNSSYIIVQSPTQSLEWHIWSSSSGNNCHAVHRSLSSGASVYECTMRFLPGPIFSAKPANAISHNCHRNVSLPSGASLWNGMFGRVEGQYTTLLGRY